MRPRVFPAEDTDHPVGYTTGRGASMRPRVFPAEDVTGEDYACMSRTASMRPRVFPAEDDDARHGRADVQALQ